MQETSTFATVGRTEIKDTFFGVIMSLLHTFDDATRSSMHGVLFCVVGSLLGVVLAFIIATFTTAGYLPVGTFLASAFVAMAGHWLFRWKRQAYDPSAVFITYLLSLCISVWIIEFFFVDPNIGPYADQLWTIPNLLTNAAFGIILFLLIGMTLGMTYFAARRTHDDCTLQRALLAFIGLGIPIYFLAHTEYFLTHFQP